MFFGEAAVLNKEFIYPPSESAGTPLTIWIAGDLDSADGRALVRAAAEHLLSEAASSRLAFVHVPTPGQRREGRRLSTLLFQLIEAGALPALDPAELIILLDEIESRGNLVDVGKITADSTDDSEAGDAPLNSFTYDGWTAADATRSPEFWRVGALVAERLKMKSAKPHILINGRVSLPVR